MTKVVVVGHGGYGSAVKRNMAMLVGVPEEFYFVDFNETDDLETLKTKLKNVVDEIGRNEQILFACDLAGGSPFRETAMLCAENHRFAVVAGINTSAYTEMTFNTELSARELAKLAFDVATQSVLIYPPEE